MSLALYKKKRNLKLSPEPAAKISRAKAHLSFVVHRHKASHLHYDFRLELDGVLKSWAVPKGPSMNPNDKRLAMMVEDHPYDYKDFEGVIPEGNYGAGIVEIWDKGEYSDLEKSNQKDAEKNIKAGLKSGTLKFVIHGKKLKGEFTLVKIRGRGENAWLLIKHRDQFATDEPYDSEEYTPANSPINKALLNNKIPVKKRVTRKTVRRAAKRSVQAKENVKAETNSDGVAVVEWGKRSKRAENYISPMLAKDTDKAFSNKDWIFEMKWDGYRAISEVNGSKVKLYSRNGIDLNDSYPVVVDALMKLKINAVLDGEIVVVDENGKSDFQLLQNYRSNKNQLLQYLVFDLLFLNNKNVCELPLLERKSLLEKILRKKSGVIKYSDHIEEKGIELFKAAVENDLEGIMAKRSDSLYLPGIRTKNWLKIKNHKTVETIIAGFTEPGGSRKYFGSLILGIFDGDELKYIGNSGSGFTELSLKQISELLKPLIRKESPFKHNLKFRMPVTWVKPKLVCEIQYSEWTKDQILRHPIFLRLRPDKKPEEVTMKALTQVSAETVSKIAGRKT